MQTLQTYRTVIQKESFQTPQSTAVLCRLEQALALVISTTLELEPVGSLNKQIIRTPIYVERGIDVDASFFMMKPAIILYAERFFDFHRLILNQLGFKRS